MHKRKIAKEWLKNKLSQGPCFAADLIDEAEKEIEVLERTLQRARVDLKFLRKKSNLGTKEFWWWYDPSIKVPKSVWLQNNSERIDHDLSNLNDFFCEEFLDDIKTEEILLTKSNADGSKKIVSYEMSPYERMKNESVYLYADTRLKNINQKVNEYREELKTDTEESQEHRKEYELQYREAFEGQPDDHSFVLKNRVPSSHFFNKTFDRELRVYNKKRGNYLSKEHVNILKIEYQKRLAAGEFSLSVVDYNDYRNVPECGSHIPTFERFSKH